MSLKPGEDAEKEQESDIAEEDNDEEIDASKAENIENFQGSGRTVTLQMLLAAKILEPGKSTMTIEYLGQKFVGDLLPDGKIKSLETETIFCSPSAWAMHCKRIINPDKKSGCGWASVKYKGKKLDAYKAAWLRKCQLQKDSTPSDEECGDGETEKKIIRPPTPIKRLVHPHNTITNRNLPHDANTLVETVSFASLNKIQPFLVSITTSSVLLMDFHCHLTQNEVVGYLGGAWDINSHTLSITHAFPCRNTKHDRHKAAEVELDIQRSMIKNNLILVGWYHSHPKCAAQPTLKDCDSQLDYQIKMRGATESTYSPCIGLICSPYCIDNPSLESSIMSFWVTPPPENKILEYGRPMQMSYSVNQDNELSNEVLTEMQACMDYYKQFPNDMIDFKSHYNEEYTYIEKLKVTMYSKFPRKQNDHEFWNWIREELGLHKEDEFTPPKWASRLQKEEEAAAAAAAAAAANAAATAAATSAASSTVHNLSHNTLSDSKMSKDDKLLIRSLQEQLSLPSGLNMNPSPISSSLLLPTTNNVPNNNLSSNNSIQTSSSSPRDSPITIPSNSASPAKFEVPIRASPSPAKSDTSSTKTRNSPAPSPSKFTANDITRNSPNITPHKYSVDLLPVSTPSTPATTASGSATNINDYYAANFSSLAKNLAAAYSPSDYAMLFQSKDYGLSSLNQLAAAGMAAATSVPSSQQQQQQLQQHQQPQTTKQQTSSSSSAAAAAASSSAAVSAAMAGNMKDFLAQLEKSSELSYFMQSQYNYPGMTMTPTSASGKSSNDYTTITATKSSSKHEKSRNVSRNSAAAQQRQFEEEYKKDANKINEFMRSQEYASLLMEQAEALNASGYGFPELTQQPQTSISTSSKKSSKRSQQQQHQQSSSSAAVAAAAAAAAAAAGMPDLTSLLQASPKIHELNSLFQASKQADLTSLLQQQLSASQQQSSGNSKKQQQQQQQQLADYSSLFSSHSKMADLQSLMTSAAAASVAGSGMHGGHHQPTAADLSALFGSTLSGKSSADAAALSASVDMLGSLLQSSAASGGGSNKQPDLSSLLFSQANAVELSNLFSQSSAASSNSSSKSSAVNNAASYYTQALDKAQQDMAALYQQHKYSAIPDPLSKTTLAANNMFMNPSTVYAKMQQEALNAMIMRPPKVSSSSSAASVTSNNSKSREASASPALEKTSSLKNSSNRDSPASMNSMKYNFSAADLAVSSVPSAAELSRKLAASGADLSSLDIGMSAAEASQLESRLKKRMEYSSIADLAAPPPMKMQKLEELANLHHSLVQQQQQLQQQHDNSGGSDLDSSTVLNLSAND